MIDKNNLRLELIDELTTKVVVAKYGVDIYDGENLTEQAQDYYNLIQEDIEDLIANYEKDIKTLQR
jgi:hypothetical protein